METRTAAEPRKTYASSTWKSVHVAGSDIVRTHGADLDGTALQSPTETLQGIDSSITSANLAWILNYQVLRRAPRSTNSTNPQLRGDRIPGKFTSL